MPSSDAWKILVLSDDPIVLAALQRIASQHGPSYSLERDLVARLERDPSWRSEAPPGAVVLDASDSDTTSRVVSAACQAWPHAVMIGFLAAPDRTKWRAAELAGCDVVTTRGALSRQLPSALAGARRGAARQRLALCDADDLAGRLGLIVHLDDSPVGPVALWTVGKELACLADRCPHAGAKLSEGSVEEGVVTCPRHGSRFVLTTGERVRGPADDAVRAFRVVREGGRVLMEWD